MKLVKTGVRNGPRSGAQPKRLHDYDVFDGDRKVACISQYATESRGASQVVSERDSMATIIGGASPCLSRNTKCSSPGPRSGLLRSN